MKKFILVIILLIASFAFAAEKPANYAGKWTLDKAQSKNLPPQYENVKSHRLFITQDEKLLNVNVEITTIHDEIDKMDFAYNLNGTESKAEALIRTPDGKLNVPAIIKAVPTAGGKLQITISREISMGEDIFKANTTEIWELSADGKILKIHRIDVFPRRTMETDMVFVKE